MRRIAVALATLCLLAGQVMFAGVVSGADPAKFTATPLTPDTTFEGTKSSSGAIAQSDPALLGRTDATPVNVMIKYDYDATASYAGGIDGLAATSPSVTGLELKDNPAAVAAYDAYTAAVSDGITADAQATVPALEVSSEYTTAYGGVAATLPANEIDALLKVDGVVAVQQDSLAQPLDDNTSFIGATAVWPSLGGPDTAGSNVVVGIIDTGIWPEHPMLAPGSLPAPSGGLKGCQFGDGSDTAHLGPTFACNNKLIGAYAKTATYMALVGADANEFCNNATHVCSPRDPEGHGTHTTTTAAGDCVATAVLYGVERGPVCGIAPGAHVIQYRVCLAEGCFGSDSVAAVQQAITDGVDVLNFSISGGAQPYSDPVELAFLDATNAGISVNASAGNSGPGSATSDHGGPWTTTVGASTGPRAFLSTLHLTADGGATFDMSGVTLTDGITTPTPVVLAQTLAKAGGGLEDALCQSPLAAGAATGKVVMCRRGTNARVDKGFNVLQGGAAGMILYNPIKQDQESDNHWLPAIHVDGPETALLAFVNDPGHTNLMATWVQGTATPALADMMAAFSSRGPLGDWIKPDITAPGVQVLAGMTPQPTGITNGPPGNLYQAIAGTSMSSPHAAGVSALVKAVHPDWTPAEIKSALMTSSVQGVVKEDGVTPATPFDMGAGSIRADRAVSPTVVFNETFANFVAAGTDPLHRIDLNIPSIDATTMTGEVTTSRTLRNVSGREQELRIAIQAPPGVTIKISRFSAAGPNITALNVSKDALYTFWVTIKAPDVADGQYFARITLTTSHGNPVTIPVAFVKKQGVVTLTSTCSPTTIKRETGLSHCSATVANFGSSPANVSIRVKNYDPGDSLLFKNIAPPAFASIGRDLGVGWDGTLSPATAPTIDSITPVDPPAFGYLPLSLFGIAPIPGVGDDTITNFDVGTFFYAGEPYTRVGVVSNGYLVIGGGTSGDVVFTPQTFPNSQRPNNVVAMWWTDLNPPAGGAIRIATLSDGSSSWLVVDWAAVKNFGGPNTHSFETWLRLASGAAGTGPASEEITMTYGVSTGPGDAGSGSNWGAENRTGSSGQNIPSQPANDTEYAVNTTGPTAGGTQTITYDTFSRRIGTWRSITQMTSNLTPGSTTVLNTFTITP
jgi:hypothetical protein